ncbi:MAG: PDZ domain-containing protein [Gammaproteobacteria bacterium]|nr:PDZ domain-containing protein [Gammaproteobacteria bacterium]
MSDEPPVRYHLSPADPGAHLFQVRCTVTDPDPDGQMLSMPAWIPGSYMVRDFARHVVRLRATGGGGEVAAVKLDKQTWRCAPCAGPLTVVYEVYAWDLSVRAAHLDTTRGYFNGTSVFLCPTGREHRDCILELRPPEGAAYAKWRVATSMARLEAAPHEFGSYIAAGYQELVDHPVEMGEHTLVGFEACGVPHEVVISGRHWADMERVRRDLRRICEHHIRFFGEPAPFDRYVFLVMAVGEGYGGLEHRASCSLMCSRDSLPRAGETDVGDDYREFLALCSHEYFHAWNVKRIKPSVFTADDLRREVHTRLLWAFEGITSYYDELALVRTGLISPASYLELLGRVATRVWRGRGRFKQSVAESSFDTWTKFYKQDENAPNAIVSYYTKGALVALALDLVIRRDTAGSRSLDDVMQALWDRYGKNGIGVPEDGVERMAEEATGLSLKTFFDEALRGTDDLPLNDLLAEVGVGFTLRIAESPDDKGGKPAESGAGKPKSVLGVRSVPEAGGSRLSHVFDGGAAQLAGLSAGDVIVAVNGIRVTGGALAGAVGRYAVGEEISVHAFRRDELMRFTVTLAAAPADTCVLSPLENVDATTLARRDAWLAAIPASRTSPPH